MRTGKAYWIGKGFLPFEASAFKYVTTEAIKDSKYITTMIETRMRYRREARSRGLDLRQYYEAIRKLYVKRGIAPSYKKNVTDNKTWRRYAFDFFNQYKDKYGIRDNSGRLVTTPRRKTRVTKKPITGKKNIDQMIRADQNEIKRLRSRLQFEKSDFWKQDIQTRIQRHQNRIANLKAQAKQSQ